MAAAHVSFGRWPALLLALCLVLTGCGSDSPTAPTPTFPNVAGVWTGEYLLAACNDQAAQGFCSGYPPVGSVGLMSLSLQQTQGQLSGTLTLGEFIVSVTGTVSSAGRIALTGRSQMLTTGIQGISISVQLSVTAWDTQASGASMTGGWRQIFDVSGDFTGRAVVDNTIRTLTRS